MTIFSQRVFKISCCVFSNNIAFILMESLIQMITCLQGQEQSPQLMEMFTDFLKSQGSAQLLVTLHLNGPSTLLKQYAIMIFSSYSRILNPDDIYAALSICLNQIQPCDMKYLEKAILVLNKEQIKLIFEELISNFHHYLPLLIFLLKNDDFPQEITDLLSSEQLIAIIQAGLESGGEITYYSIELASYVSPKIPDFIPVIYELRDKCESIGRYWFSVFQMAPQFCEPFCRYLLMEFEAEHATDLYATSYFLLLHSKQISVEMYPQYANRMTRYMITSFQESFSQDGVGDIDYQILRFIPYVANQFGPDLVFETFFQISHELIASNDISNYCVGIIILPFIVSLNRNRIETNIDDIVQFYQTGFTIDSPLQIWVVRALTEFCKEYPLDLSLFWPCIVPHLSQPTPLTEDAMDMLFSLVATPFYTSLIHEVISRLPIFVELGNIDKALEAILDSNCIDNVSDEEVDSIMQLCVPCLAPDAPVKLNVIAISLIFEFHDRCQAPLPDQALQLIPHLWQVMSAPVDEDLHSRDQPPYVYHALKTLISLHKTIPQANNTLHALHLNGSPLHTLQPAQLLFTAYLFSIVLQNNRPPTPIFQEHFVAALFDNYFDILTHPCVTYLINNSTSNVIEICLGHYMFGYVGRYLRANQDIEKFEQVTQHLIGRQFILNPVHSNEIGCYLRTTRIYQHELSHVIFHQLLEAPALNESFELQNTAIYIADKFFETKFITPEELQAAMQIAPVLAQQPYHQQTVFSFVGSIGSANPEYAINFIPTMLATFVNDNAEKSARGAAFYALHMLFPQVLAGGAGEQLFAATQMAPLPKSQMHKLLRLWNQNAQQYSADFRHEMTRLVIRGIKMGKQLRHRCKFQVPTAIQLLATFNAIEPVAPVIAEAIGNNQFLAHRFTNVLKQTGHETLYPL